MKHYRNPESIHPPLAAYTHQVEIVNPQRQLIISGQIGMDINGIIPNSSAEQFSLALDNTMKNLAAANMKKEDIDKMTIYFVEDISREERIKMLADKLGDHKPCMTLIYVSRLANAKIMVEIEATASCAG